MQLQELNNRFTAVPIDALLPSWWAEFLEAPGLSPEEVALAITFGGPHWHALLHWWGRCRHVRSPISAQALMQQEGMTPGPELGERLAQMRLNILDKTYK